MTRRLTTRRLPTRPLLAAIALLTAAAPAAACEFYREVGERTSVYDMPSTGSGLAVAIVPSGARACVVEEGEGDWIRLAFYTHQDVKYTVDGWIDGSAAGETVVAAATESAPSAADGATDGKAAFFSRPWTLDPAKSSLNFVSVKKGSVVESHSFSGLSGGVAGDGTAEIRIALDTVETGVDLRNVRMRFLLFNIAEHPEATVTAQLDPLGLEALWDDRRIAYDLPVSVSLHGVSKEFSVPVTVTRVDDDMVSVASRGPVLVAGEDFELGDGVRRLSASVGDIDITPSAPVTFDLTFVGG